MLIGVNGQLGSGKDATFERAGVLWGSGALKGRLPGRPSRRAFADKLKDSICTLLMISRDLLEILKRDDYATIEVRSPRFRISYVRGFGWTRALPGMTKVHSRQTVRSGLQRQGTEVGRNIFGETFWVDQCVPAGLRHEDEVIMVTDVRFPNEAERIRAEGGVVVRVLNGELIKDGHDSEQILDDDLIDFEIDNSVRDDGFANLDQQVTTLFRGVQISASENAVENTRYLPPVQVDGVLRIDDAKRELAKRPFDD